MNIDRFYSSNPSFDSITLASGSVLRWVKQAAVNLNTTGDVVVATGLSNGIVIDRLVMANWSTTPSALLIATLRDAAAAAGNSLVGSVAGLNALVTATSLSAVASPLSTTLGAQRVVSSNALYVNVSAANGTALTADIYIFYWVLP